jgi:hypothetical protein
LLLGLTLLQVGCVGVDDLDLLDAADYEKMDLLKFDEKKLKKVIGALAVQGMCS